MYEDDIHCALTERASIPSNLRHTDLNREVVHYNARCSAFHPIRHRKPMSSSLIRQIVFTLRQAFWAIAWKVCVPFAVEVFKYLPNVECFGRGSYNVFSLVFCRVCYFGRVYIDHMVPIEMAVVKRREMCFEYRSYEPIIHASRSSEDVIHFHKSTGRKSFFDTLQSHCRILDGFKEPFIVDIDYRSQGVTDILYTLSYILERGWVVDEDIFYFWQYIFAVDYDPYDTPYHAVFQHRIVYYHHTLGLSLQQFAACLRNARRTQVSDPGQMIFVLKVLGIDLHRLLSDFEYGVNHFYYIGRERMGHRVLCVQRIFWCILEMFDENDVSRTAQAVEAMNHGYGVLTHLYDTAPGLPFTCRMAHNYGY